MTRRNEIKMKVVFIQVDNKVYMHLNEVRKRIRISSFSVVLQRLQSLSCQATLYRFTVLNVFILDSLLSDLEESGSYTFEQS